MLNFMPIFAFTLKSSKVIQHVFYLMMYYPDAKCEKKKLVDTVEFSPYESKIHSFKSQKNNTYVVLWEIEYEYFPVILAYYIVEGKLVRIGELEISLPCQSCESFEYPIKDIKYKENNEWKLFKTGDLKYRFNIETKELKHITLQN